MQPLNNGDERNLIKFGFYFYLLRSRTRICFLVRFWIIQVVDWYVEEFSTKGNEMGPSQLRNPNVFDLMVEGPWEIHSWIHKVLSRTKTFLFNLNLKMFKERK